MNVDQNRRALSMALALAPACGVLLGRKAFAEDFPTRAITIVEPFQPGSASDLIGRQIGQAITAELKVPVLLDSKPGADGAIASRLVAQAKPDGYTWLISGNTTHAANEHMYKKLPYDPVKDFTPISLIYKGYMVLSVNAASPYRSVADLVARAKAAPGKVSFGAGSFSGRGSAEMLRQMAGVQFTHVPYKSNPQGMADLLGGQIDFMFTDPATALPHIESGKLRALGVTSRSRLPAMGDVPTIEESGFKGYEMLIWLAAYAPAGVPPALQARLNAIVKRALDAPEVKAFGLKNTLSVVSSSPAELAAFQAAETEKAGRIVRAAGIEPG